MILDRLRAVPDVRWSAAVRRDGTVVDEVGADVVLPTASVGKILLLVTVAEQIEHGVLDPAELLRPTEDVMVADSGILQFFSDAEQRVDDLAVLVGAVSDNLATNLLITRVGLDAVRATSARLGVTAGALHDLVRDRRRVGDPPYLSTGAAGEWAALFERLAGGRLSEPAVDARVRRWLAANTDLSMVASAFSLDPLAHSDGDLGVVLVNKTGTNLGTRADVGVVTAAKGTLAYAVIARWEEDTYRTRTAILDAMRATGGALREALLGGA